MISGMSEGWGWVKLGKTAILERKKNGLDLGNVIYCNIYINFYKTNR